MIRVIDLEESIRFYTGHLGMRVLKRMSDGEGKWIAFIGYGDESSNTVLELNHSIDKLQFVRGEFFGHIAIGVPNVEKTFEDLRAMGVKTLKPPRVKDGEMLASVEDPNGYKIELIEDHFHVPGGGDEISP